MSEKPLLNHDTNKEQARSSIDNDREALVLPVFNAKEVVLHYHRGMLQPHGLLDDPVFRGRVKRPPKNLYEQYPTWGGFRVKDLYIKCRLLTSGVLLAETLTTGKGDYHSAALNLQLLHGHGFSTILPFTGWIDLRDCKRSRHIERLLEQRLALINEVVNGERASLWNEGRGSDRWQQLAPVKNVLVLDCIGFVPTVDDPHVRSVYKA